MDIITLKDICLNINNKKVFDNLNLNIKEGDFITILGHNGSGKSTLIKVILGIIKATGEVKVFGEELTKESVKEIISKIGTVFENPDNQFITSSVMEELAFPLENRGVNPSEIKSKILDIAKKFNFDDKLDRSPHTLSGGEKQVVALMSALIIDPKILIIDEGLSMIDLYDRENIYKILKKYNKDSKMTIINTTHDVDEVLYAKTLIIMNSGKIVSSGALKKVLSNENNFTSNNIDLPFTVDLSNKLKYYDLLNTIMLNMEDIVDEIWK